MVYFLHAPAQRIIKIGFSETVFSWQRIAAIHNQLRVPLVLLGLAPGGLDAELDYHRRFAGLKAENQFPRRNGLQSEWFREAEELFDAIRTEAFTDPVAIARNVDLLTDHHKPKDRAAARDNIFKLLVHQWIYEMAVHAGSARDDVAFKALNAYAETIGFRRFPIRFESRIGVESCDRDVAVG